MSNNKNNNGQGERLTILVIHFNITTRNLAKMIGRNENTLYKINCGQSRMSESTAAKICYWLEKKKGVRVNKNWLLTGEGKMIDEKPTSTQKINEDNTQLHIEKKTGEDNKDYREKYYELLEKYSELQDKYFNLIGK